ncbi:hypothetical protein VKT23_008521 [Stygiomarasmius scandens]|uniref:Cyanovirin-N domain-containing protein n=1 Tax=Marasmiellus scandens TaxID=2682957 RepID=A0ABR1JJG9_9AGAR
MSLELCRNPRIQQERFVVDFQGSNGQLAELSISLDDCLGNIDGKFTWGSRGVTETARNLSVDRFRLSAELQDAKREDWHLDQIDLSEHIRFNDGKLEYVQDSNGSIDPPPAYTGSGFMEYMATRSSESRTSCFFQYQVSTRNMSFELKGSTLRFGSSSIDLDEHIGIVNGKLVWGSKGFFQTCGGLLELDEYTLVVQFEEQELKLDLTRYLEIHHDEIRVRVEESDEELSRLFSESRWMKFKVVTEPDVSEVVDSLTFSEAFGRLEESSRTLVAEMTRELVHSGSQKIMQSVTEQVMSRNTQELIDEIRESLRGEIEVAFESTKKSVFASCDKMIEASVTQMDQDHIGEMTRVITSQCEETIKETIKQTTVSAIEDFQGRVAVLMEGVISGANMKRAQTKAALLKMIEQGEYI